MTETLRMRPDARRADLLDGMIGLARRVGYNLLTRERIAIELGVSAGLVSHYFGTMREIRRAIIREAIRRGVPEIIAHGLTSGDKLAHAASPDQKRQAARTLTAKG